MRDWKAAGRAGILALTWIAAMSPAGRGQSAAVPPGGLADDASGPLSPREALGAFRLKAGFRIELVVAEPLVIDPVAIDFGGDGRLWVCEMRDYPSGVDGNGKPGGVIKVLEDRDGDGRYETATSFLEGVPFPTGVMAWRGGALICAAPEILYAEDRDGDGKADVREVLYRGFATENYQARVNGLSYHLDNWVYGANGLIGGTIRGLANRVAVDIGGRDFRFRPDGGRFEPASGLSQQGRVHDDWGEQFGGNNSVLIQHYPLPDRASRRNPAVAAPSPSVYVPRDPESTRIYPSSRTLERFNQPQSAGRVTSACGLAIYRDDLLGPSYAGNAFICEPVHNLVHRQVLSPDGVTFAGHRGDGEATSEFLASTDNWFRPVQVRTGPDGALWIVDMYRFVIEHPRWISPERLAALDVRAGQDRGRIYRVNVEGHPHRAAPNLERLPTAALAEAIDSPNGTLRDNVQRLLVHRGDRSATATLERLARTGRRPVGRSQALGALDGLGALRPELVREALADPHPGVRRQAVRLAEGWLGTGDAMGRALIPLVSDPDIRVRYQLALGLGEWDDPRGGTALGKLAVRDGGDRWVRAAIVSSATRHSAAILAAIVSEAPSTTRDAMVGPLVATLAAEKDPRAFARIVETLPEPKPGDNWWFDLFGEWFERGGTADLSPEVRRRWRIVRDRGWEVANDERMPAARRLGGFRVLGHAIEDRDRDHRFFAAMLEARQASAIQKGALRGLTRSGDAQAVGHLIDVWPALGPSVRGEVLDLLLARETSTRSLVEALRVGRIAATEVDASHRQRLLAAPSPDIRALSARIFGAEGPRPRAAVLDAYRPALATPGDRNRGRSIFARACAGCHALDGQGKDVGPDLAALTDTTPESLLTAILDPNRDVDARYVSYAAALRDGRVIAGLIASETGNAITLKRQDGAVDVVLRSDLETIRSSGKSLMPEGLENDLKPGDLADLIAYLGARRPPPGRSTRTLRGR